MLLKAITVISIADLSAFIDYGHLHLCPALERPTLQTLGLILSAAGALWLLWTDRYLIAHFTGDMSHRGLLEEGPYRFVRHPRYLALIVSRVAFALALASVLAWALLVVWLIFILRRIRLEEAHMRKVFGADYAAYSRRTARLIPGVY